MHEMAPTGQGCRSVGEDPSKRRNEAPIRYSPNGDLASPYDQQPSVTKSVSVLSAPCVSHHLHDSTPTIMACPLNEVISLIETLEPEGLSALRGYGCGEMRSI